MRASRGLKWENKMYKPKRSIEEQMFLFTKGTQRRFNHFQFIQLLVLNFLVLRGHVILRAKKKNGKVR